MPFTQDEISKIEAEVKAERSDNTVALTDAQYVDLLAKCSLHSYLQIRYNVDSYVVRLLDDNDMEVVGPCRGETIREALLVFFKAFALYRRPAG